MPDPLQPLVRRVGLLGGSFDPPHLAHRALGLAALKHLQLDALRVLPAGNPWQKPGRRLAAGEHRLAMCHLLWADEPRVVLDGRELRRPGPSYTVETLEQLHSESDQREPTHWVLIVGEDQWARFKTWHRWADIMRLAEVAVASRHGVTSTPTEPSDNTGLRVTRLPFSDWPVSSTDIRQALADGRDVTPLVGPAVARYIAEHGLYPRTSDI